MGLGAAVWDPPAATLATAFAPASVAGSKYKNLWLAAGCDICPPPCRFASQCSLLSVLARRERIAEASSRPSTASIAAFHFQVVEWSGGAMYPRIRTIIAEARLDSGSGGGYDSSSGGGSSSGSPGASESDGSSSPDEFYCPHDPRELLRRHVGSPLSVRGDEDADREVSDSVSSPRVLDDIHRHQQRLLLLLPAFAASPAVAAERAEVLSCWLSGFGVGWVLDMDPSGESLSLPRMELGQLGRRVSAWAQALSTMERVFRLQLQRRELRPPAQAAALEELAVASAGAMLKPVGAVAALGSSPTTLLMALDLYAPVSETYPALARLFSWGPSHPLSAAADAALAALVDAALRGRRDLAAFVRSYHPWRAPEGSDVHPCVGFWMSYFLCLLRNRVSLFFILGGGDDDNEADAEEGALGGVVAELISHLEAVLEETSAAAALDSPGLRQVFMLNNAYAITRRAVDSGLDAFLPLDWTRVREESVDGYIRGYMDATWTPVVSRLDTGGGAKKSPVSRRRRNPLGAFYSAFDKACGAQRCWKVPDPVLRGVLRETVAENLVPPYRRYLEDHPEIEVAGGRTAEELDKQLTDLFEG
ncbi:hypothetical protein U9M48_029493 [Paspalum notatum var. saurae]|uniref:Exocyst subunit Exo70 family protein n=1 Tax=Paspalum notatum var. saurae TaxID=547442 RepID=A0AAQ3X262_PASNO